jgi:Uma2 family endonuclease
MSLTFTLTHNTGEMTVPSVLPKTLAEFREWVGNSDLPEKTRVGFYKDAVWIDMSNEQLYTHALVKGRIYFTLTQLATADGLGECFPDGILVSNFEAGVSNNPDLVFVSFDGFEAGRVELKTGASHGFVELIGTPDMVLEVVSDRSEHKDTVVLREAYWEAGIPEYWLVDARGDQPDFRILKSTPTGYTETRKVAGWQRSAIYRKSFRLLRGVNRLGHPEFTLEVK